MKKLKLPLLALFLLGFIVACSDDDDTTANGDGNGNGVVDTEAPEFVEITRPRTEGGSGVVRLRGEYAEVRSESSTHMHMRGTVTDNVALGQLIMDIHGVMDGHSHGRLSNDKLLPEWSLDSVIDLGGVTEFDFDIDGYYDAENFRAGPYDVILHASDEAGNQTSFASGTSVLRQIYLRRPYQPLITIVGDPNEEEDEIEVEEGEELSIDGYIQAKRGGLDLAITFIRIQIGEDGDHDHRVMNGEYSYDKFWGESRYSTNAAGGNLVGDDLPEADADDRIWLNWLLRGDNAYIGDDHDDHGVLRIIVEDEGGNMAIREFELEVD